MRVAQGCSYMKELMKNSGQAGKIFLGPYNYNKFFVATQHSHILCQKNSVVKCKNGPVFGLLLQDGSSNSDETCWVNHVCVKEHSQTHFYFHPFSREKVYYISNSALKLQLQLGVDIALRAGQ